MYSNSGPVFGRPAEALKKSSFRSGSGQQRRFSLQPPSIKMGRFLPRWWTLYSPSRTASSGDLRPDAEAETESNACNRGSSSGSCWLRSSDQDGSSSAKQDGGGDLNRLFSLFDRDWASNPVGDHPLEEIRQRSHSESRAVDHQVTPELKHRRFSQVERPTQWMYSAYGGDASNGGFSGRVSSLQSLPEDDQPQNVMQPHRSSPVPDATQQSIYQRFRSSTVSSARRFSHSDHVTASRRACIRPCSDEDPKQEEPDHYPRHRSVSFSQLLVRQSDEAAAAAAAPPGGYSARKKRPSLGNLLLPKMIRIR